MGWLKSSAPPPPPDRVMVGAKAGDRVLVMGAGDGRLAAALGVTTGLNGRTLVADATPGAEARVADAAARAGALVEFDAAAAPTLAVGDATFDIVVILYELSTRPGAATHLMSEAARVARPGGRVIVVERAERSGFGALLSSRTRPPLPVEHVLALLSDAGLRGTRALGDLAGDTFVEGTKPQQ